MPTQSASETFLRLLERSGIVPAERFSSLAREFEESPGESPNAEQLANALVERSVLTRWQADQLLDGKYKGFILGPYRILRPLGQGGMGTVFLAEHQMMRRRCAVKVLPAKRVQAQPALVEWFYREARAVGALDHPNIVRAYDVNQASQDGREIHFLVMEYIDGQDLQHRVMQQGLPSYGEAADWIRQAAEGLAHAHEAGFVHRDIKPANLLVDNRGVVKILDLGLARFFNEADEAAAAEQGGMVVGTADYVAPEQVVDSSNVDARADIYSLGHTFYFLLTGHPPFPEGSIPQRLLAHQMKFPEPIQRERPDVSPELVAIINRMTAKKPKDRQQTAREVADSLKKWLEGSPDHSGFLRRFLRTPQTGSASAAPVGEPHENGSVPADDEDLELAPIEEEQKPPTSSGSFRTSQLTKPPETKNDSGTHETAPNLSASKESQTRTESPAKQPAALSSDLPNLGPPADPLASLLDAEGLPPVIEKPIEAPTGGPPAAKRPMASKKGKKGPAPESLLQTPVFWVGVGALVFAIAMVWFVASQISSSGTSTELSGPPPSLQTSDVPEPAEPSPRPDEPQRAPEAGAQGQQAPASRPKNGGTAAPPKSPAGDSAPQRPKPKPPENSGGASAAAASEGDAATTTPLAGPSGKPPKKPQTAAPKHPKEPEKAQGAQPGSNKPKSEPAKPAPPKVDTKALFAGMQNIWFQAGKGKPIPNPAFNAMVTQLGLQAADRAGLRVDPDASAVMEVSVQAEKPAGPGQGASVVMAAELKCKASNGEMVTVWEHQAQIGEVAWHMLRQKQLLLLRPEVKDFFDKFVDDYHDASK